MLPVGYLLLVWGVPSATPATTSVESSVLTSTHRFLQTHPQPPFTSRIITTTNNNDTPHELNFFANHWYPTLVMVFLGLSYALSNCFLWSTLTDVLPIGAHKEIANGLVACGVNVLPSIIPPLLTSICRWFLTINALYLHDMFPLFLLAGLAVGACVFAIIASTLTGSENFLTSS